VTALRQLLEVEDAEELLLPLCPVTGIPVWAVVRNQFFRLVMSDLLYPSRPLLSTAQRLPFLRVLKSSLCSAAYNMANPPTTAKLLIRASGVGLVERDGRSFNRYTDYFGEVVSGNAWSFEDLASWEWPALPRWGRVSYTTAAFASIRLSVKLRIHSVHRDLATHVIDLALRRAARLLNWDPRAERRTWLIEHTARRLASLPMQHALMRRWINRVRPAVFLVEEGSYGHMAAFNLAAREQGIKVAEFQHGAVTSGHDVYNVAPCVAANPAYRRCLPDAFLGYGSWWNTQFNLPIEKRVIGNPHREAVRQAGSLHEREPNRILVLGDGRELETHFALCQQLSLRLSGWLVVFRPHPEERVRVLQIDATAIEGFAIDRESDIYVSLAKSEAVVAELSTGLFDGVGLARRIFVWDTPKSRFGLPTHPFSSFSDVAELVAAMGAPQEGNLSSEQLDSIWASGWRKRFVTFLSECGVQAP
jgi:hypothetical protein